MKLKLGVAFATTMLIAVTFLGLAPTASAHYCKSNVHSDCNSHSCPDDGQNHEHRHDVRWHRDHYCKSHPLRINDALADPFHGLAPQGLTAGVAEYGIIIDEIECDGSGALLPTRDTLIPVSYGVDWTNIAYDYPPCTIGPGPIGPLPPVGVPGEPIDTLAEYINTPWTGCYFAYIAYLGCV